MYEKVVTFVLYYIKKKYEGICRSKNFKNSDR